MKPLVGVWIDHRKAVITAIRGEQEETSVIRSDVEKQPGRFEGVRSTTSYESQKVPADDRREKEFTGQLNRYYDEVIACVREAGRILILGPGEAKSELRKRLEQATPDARIEAIEVADKMTDRQITARVREYFRKQDSAPGAR